MTPIELAAFVGLVLAAQAVLLALVNLAVYSPPAASDGASTEGVSVLIPARNEEGSIGEALDSVAANHDVPLEIVVMDDHSDDRTAEIVTDRAARDPRIRLLHAPALPPGWNGKQHACAALAAAARHDVLLFMDADVRLAHGAVARLTAELEARNADLVSGFPRQITGSFLEHLLIPMIHFVLLGFLPIPAMRRSRRAAFGSACGQLIAVRRSAYEHAGGHGAIRASRHDGLTLPRVLRRSGSRTDLFDATTIARCRMYESASEVWNGLAKNSTEGMGSARSILPWTFLLLGGQVVPPALLLAAVVSAVSPAATLLASAAVGGTLLVRALMAWRFRHSWLGVLLHPLAVVLLIAVQWYALGREVAGQPISWKGRFGGEETERAPAPGRNAA